MSIHVLGSIGTMFRPDDGTSKSFTAPAAANFLLVLHHADFGESQAFTWNGTSLGVQVQLTTNSPASVHYLANPSSGTHNFTLTDHGRATYAHLIWLSGVDVANPFYDTQSVSNVSITVAGLSGGYAFDAIGKTTSAGSQLWDLIINSTGGAAYTSTSGGNVTNTWASGNNHVAVALKPKGGANQIIHMFYDLRRRWAEHRDIIVPRGLDGPIWRPRPQVLVP